MHYVAECSDNLRLFSLYIQNLFYCKSINISARGYIHPLTVDDPFRSQCKEEGNATCGEK